MNESFTFEHFEQFLTTTKSPLVKALDLQFEIEKCWKEARVMSTVEIELRSIFEKMNSYRLLLNQAYEWLDQKTVELDTKETEVRFFEKRQEETERKLKVYEMELQRFKQDVEKKENIRLKRLKEMEERELFITDKCQEYERSKNMSKRSMVQFKLQFEEKQRMVEEKLGKLSLELEAKTKQFEREKERMQLARDKLQLAASRLKERESLVGQKETKMKYQFSEIKSLQHELYKREEKLRDLEKSADEQKPFITDETRQRIRQYFVERSQKPRA